MPAPIAAAGGALLRGIVGSGARGAAAGGVRGLLSSAKFSVSDTIRGVAGNKIRDMVTGAGKKVQDQSQIINVVQSPIQEGFATAVKGSGVISGAIVPTGGGALVSRKSSAIVKPGKSGSIVDQLAALRAKLDQLIEIELAAKKSIEDQILKYVRDSEKDARSEEQKNQEASNKKSNVEKNPVVKAGKKAFGGIFDFIKGLVIDFIKYKILDWISKPENKKHIQGTIQFFMNFFKTLKLIYDIVLGPQLKLVGMLTSLIAGGINKFFDFIGGVVNFFSLKWLPNVDSIIDTVKNIPKIFTEMIPNAINGIIDFFTKSLFGAAEEEGDRAVSSAVGESQSGRSVSGEPEQQKGSGGVGDALKGAAGTVGAVLNPIGAIGKFIGGMFGGGDKSEPPKLRKGGIVSKNKNNNVSVKPLDELSNIANVASSVKKPMKMFMKLLTMPFKLVGAAMIALVMNTVGKIPGVKMFLKPVVDNIVKSFDLPPSIAKISEFGITFKKEEKEKKKPQTTSKKSGDTPPGRGTAADSIDQSSASAAAAGKQGAGSEDMKQSGATANMQAGQASQTSGQFSSTSEDRKGGEVPFKLNGKEYKVIINATNGHYEVWDRNPMPWSKPYDISNDQNTVLKQKAFNQVRAYFVNNAPQKGIDLKYITKDDVSNKKILEQAKKEQEAASGGWISGPMSGYPVSLDGGRSASFIGHGLEWVGMKRSSGGNVNSAFVIPYNTPRTKSNLGLTASRYNQAKSGGYGLPQFAAGGMHPYLEKLSDGKIRKHVSGSGLCVTGSLETMQKSGVPNPHATGNDDGNNPRGAAVQLIKSFGWKSVGGTPFTLKSPYGTVTTGVYSKGEYAKAVDEGKIPSGALIFQTRHASWNGTSHKSRGYDFAIAQKQGRALWNGDPAGLYGQWVYGSSTKNIIALTPGGKASDGSPPPGASGDQQTPGSDNSANPPAGDQSQPDASPQITGSLITDIRELYNLLNGGAGPAGGGNSETSAPAPVPASSITPSTDPPSSALPKAQTENSNANAILRSQALVGSSKASTPTFIDASKSSSTSSSSSGNGQSLGGTLPKDGNWSIFRTNL